MFLNQRPLSSAFFTPSAPPSTYTFKLTRQVEIRQENEAPRLVREVLGEQAHWPAPLEPGFPAFV